MVFFLSPTYLPTINNPIGIGSKVTKAIPIRYLGVEDRGCLVESEQDGSGYSRDNMDPYAILICRTQEQRSSTATGKGSEPEWNETFVFNVSDDVPELAIKLMDSDTFSDDFVGEAKIPLEPLFSEGRIPPTVYNVVKDEEYRGEIKIGLTFIPEVFLLLNSTASKIYYALS
ncbi:Elicitor-responsive protein 3 [Dendrobium catenatum]|uniref:Elicitor-responsive protein 3 n=1 Tax=Dendrobium catenatum TaxID=906689 RepID=A0A2I0VLA1_9ASPA|nr:Elicitor-responsive protein 3 [Dendrobium catenatum]